MTLGKTLFASWSDSKNLYQGILLQRDWDSSRLTAGEFMMKFALLLLMFVTAGEKSTHQIDLDEQRTLHEINLDVKAFFKRETVAKEDGTWMASIRDICTLYHTIKRDPRLSDSRLLQGYKAKVWARMKKIEKELVALKRSEERAQKANSKSNRSKQNLPKTQLASQWVPNEIDETQRFLAEQLTMLNAGSGGPSTVVGFANGAWGGGTINDYSDDLIRLIQTTIEPDFWDINGGPGTIYYYRPLHALVIRATSTVHEKIGGAVEALGRAGR